jgi:hypothetical protein
MFFLAVQRISMMLTLILSVLRFSAAAKGTMFGKNTIAGVFNFTTRDSDFSGSHYASVGTGEHQRMPAPPPRALIIRNRHDHGSCEHAQRQQRRDLGETTGQPQHLIKREKEKKRKDANAAAFARAAN